jgi:NAD(P)H dehydrogenase (quinone)
MPRLVVVYHSGYGHTAKVAEAVHMGILSLQGFEAFLIPVEDAIQNMQPLHDADGIIFGAPTYMGSASAPFKAFMDATSKVWFEQKWKDKIAAGFTNSGGMSGDKLSTLSQFAVFAGQHGMLWVSLGKVSDQESKNQPGQMLDRVGSHLGLMTQANVSEGSQTAPPAIDLETAEAFGKRVALATQRWVNGKR